jgi:hypothetical protein
VGYAAEQPAVAAWRGMSEGDMRLYDIVNGDTMTVDCIVQGGDG